jgi:hypothetical protein
VARYAPPWLSVARPVGLVALGAHPEGLGCPLRARAGLHPRNRRWGGQRVPVRRHASARRSANCFGLTTLSFSPIRRGPRDAVPGKASSVRVASSARLRLRASSEQEQLFGREAAEPVSSVPRGDRAFALWWSFDAAVLADHRKREGAGPLIRPHDAVFRGRRCRHERHVHSLNFAYPSHGTVCAPDEAGNASASVSAMAAMNAANRRFIWPPLLSSDKATPQPNREQLSSSRAVRPSAHTKQRTPRSFRPGRSHQVPLLT